MTIYYPAPPWQHIWSAKSIQWATERGLSQSEVDRIEDNLTQFRAKRDYFQWLRREQVLPQLKAQKSALEREIEQLVEQRNAASKRDKEIIENKLRPIQWEYQYLWGQVAVIESEHEALTARVPARWRSAVYEVGVTESEAA